MNQRSIPSSARLALLASLALLVAWQPAEAGEFSHLPASAVAADGMDAGEARIVGRLLVDLDSTPARVGVLFELDPGWHLYWRNPGQTGLPTEIVWRTTGGQTGPLAWPAPIAFQDLATGLESYGYEGRVLLISPLAGQPERVAADVELLVCHDKCIPAAFSLERTLAQQRASAHKAAESEVFAAFSARVPEPARAAGVEVDAAYSRTRLRPGDPFEAALLVRDGEVPDAAAPFFADLAAAESLELEVLGSSPHPHEPGVHVVALRGEVGEIADALAERAALTGVLALRDGAGNLRHVEIAASLPLAAAGAPSNELGRHWLAAAPTPTTSFLALARVILLALLGGLVLNGMPCVLPVLGIKVCSVAELAQKDRGELRRHGIAYAAGVLSSMALLAAVVLALQAAGTRVGWGFQFQEPLFVAIVTSVVVLFALNLFGVFEINLSAGKLSNLAMQRQGTTRSFFDGLLCVVLATPCTAPFLGTAVGFAFAGGPATIVAVFLAIGAGLAAPYTLICLVPGWARFVPRAGGWMLRLRAGLGFLLLGTAVWLLWIFGRSAGVDGFAALLALLVVLAFGTWLLGWVQTLARPRASLGALAALVLIAVAGLNTVRVQASVAGDAPEAATVDGWRAYDAAAIQASIAERRPVFVTFTADWCITCKVNEAGVLSDEQVRRSLTERGYDRYRGDWTQRDEAIRAELARHGRAGVPLYLVYDPRQPDAPIVLPEILSLAGVLSALSSASAGLPAVATAH